MVTKLLYNHYYRWLLRTIMYRYREISTENDLEVTRADARWQKTRTRIAPGSFSPGRISPGRILSTGPFQT